MEHIVKNTDGSYTSVDSEKDGLGLWWFSVWWEKMCNRKFPFFCKICDDRFRTQKECLSHIRKVHKIKVNKEGREVLK